MGVSRLTVNKDWNDASKLGDRTLAIWVGAGYYHFTTYNISPANLNIWKNVNYNQLLDGSWNYIYFCYKRFNENEGKANGFVLFDG